MQAHIIRRWSVAAALLLIIGSIAINKILAGMKDPPREDAPKSEIVPVQVRMVENTTQMAGLPINGRLYSSEKFDVYTEVNGRLLTSEKPFKDGVAFKKGEVLLQIDATDARLNLIATRSGFQALLTGLMTDLKYDFEKNYDAWNKYLMAFDPSKEVSELPAVTDQKEKNFLVSKNVFNQFYAIRSMEAQLRKYTIVAPFDGIVSEANVNPSTILRAGQRIGVFIDPINFEMEAGVSVSEVSKVAIGNTVDLNSNDIEGSWRGKVIRKSEMVDAKTQNVKIYISVSGSSLYEGVYLNGLINGQALDSAATIPRYLVLNNSEVFVVENNQLKLQHVNIIHESNDVMVVRGLANGTQLVDQVVPGAHKGMAVEIVNE
jgi:membrane fusion protein, multidrug efflux system